MALTMPWAEKVNAMSNGELNVTYIGDGDVAGYFEQAEAMSNGVFDIWFGGIAPMETRMPSVAASPLSEITPWEERDRGYADWMNERMEETWGFHYLGRPSWGRSWYWGVNFKVDNPKEDFKGHILGSEPMIESFAQATGAATEQVQTADKYSAMEQGIIEGWMMPIDNAVSWSYYEVTDYIINVGFYGSSNVHLVMSQAVWDSLSKDQQKVLDECTQELEREAEVFYGDSIKKAWDVIHANCEVIDFSPEDAKWFYDLGTNAQWDNVKSKVSPEDYNQLREFLIK